jgi:hypothetical protein
MSGNKTVIAILFGALMICATIYFVGKKPEKVPTVVVPESAQSQTVVALSPTANPISTATPTAALDDLSPIALAIGKELSVDPATLVITKSKQIGAYAIGGVTDKGASAGGAQWWGVKENGVWKYIFSGQSYPKCSVVAAYQIPKELLDSCWDDATDKLKSL